LASNTKKREGKVRSSLELFFVFIIGFFLIAIIITIIAITVPSLRIFHVMRGKRRIDCGLGVRKTHGSVHLALTLL
jgi:hypothetical protein